jgi:hypothetical protein
MDTIKQTDRTNWKPGPWDNEPDRIEFEHEGFPCLMTRGPIGAWCGYVAVPPTHPWHGVDYWPDEKHPVMDVSVHGGLTYASSCYGQICHVPKPGDTDDVWWFGFDCAHAYDETPYVGTYGSSYGTYRDVAYVKAEVEKLATQLKEVA